MCRYACVFTLDVCDIENRECDITTNSLYSFSALMRKETGSDRAGKKRRGGRGVLTWLESATDMLVPRR